MPRPPGEVCIICIGMDAFNAEADFPIYSGGKESSSAKKANSVTPMAQWR